MHVFADPFWAAKQGNKDSEYEDAFWPRKSKEEPMATCFRCAVADGATETSYSGIWAKQLVHCFGKNSNAALYHKHGFCHLQQRWSKKVHRRPLPWYAEEKARQGAFAAILGLVLYDAGRRWQAVAVGDSCLFHMRGEEILARFPLAASAAFNNRPHLLSSNPIRNSWIEHHVRKLDGTWQVDDAFYLMTDALACWFMKEDETGRMPWRVLRDLDTHDQGRAFREWIEDLRRKGAIRNDDVTLLRVNMA